jgi:hypothetical protein
MENIPEDSPKVYLKIHSMQSRQFLSCCDSELIDQTFTEGKCYLTVPAEFYKGEELTLEEACEIISKNLTHMDSVHVIGERIINHLHENDVIDKSASRRVANVPHIMFMRM